MSTWPRERGGLPKEQIRALCTAVVTKPGLWRPSRTCTGWPWAWAQILGQSEGWVQVPCLLLPGEALHTSRLLNLSVFFVFRMVSVGINGRALKLTKW